jgi:hypothetical protein
MVTSVPRSVATGGEPLTGVNVNVDAALTLGVSKAEPVKSRVDDNSKRTRYEMVTLLAVKWGHAMKDRQVRAI